MDDEGPADDGAEILVVDSLLLSICSFDSSFVSTTFSSSISSFLTCCSCWSGDPSLSTRATNDDSTSPTSCRTCLVFSSSARCRSTTALRLRSTSSLFFRSASSRARTWAWTASSLRRFSSSCRLRSAACRSCCFSSLARLRSAICCLSWALRVVGCRAIPVVGLLVLVVVVMVALVFVR